MPALDHVAKIGLTEHECSNCNEKVFRWIDFDDGQEFWATETGRSTCGRSGSFHLVNEF